MPEPAAAQKSPTKVVSPQGLWRDGHFLVVHRRVTRLPDRCVKTNKAGPIEYIEWTARWTPVNAGVRVAGALATGGMTNHLVNSTADEMPLTIAVGKTFMAGQRKANYISGGLVVVGILVTLAALPILLVLSNTMPMLAMGFGGLVGLAGLVITAIGGAILLQKSQTILECNHMTKELGWFTGVHPEYLAALPAQPATHSITAPAAPVSH